MISIKIKSDNPIPVVIPEGRLDFANSTEFDQALRPIVETNKFLIIDLSQCNYLSSAGIRILLMTQKKLLAKGGGVYLSGLSPDVYQVIEMAGLHQVFPNFATSEAARIEIEKAQLKASEYIEWSECGYSFRYHMIESERKQALLWKDDGIAGYNELEFSVGAGSPAEATEDDKHSHGVFITCGGCAGFIPDNEELPPDFRVPGKPADAGVYVNMALSFSGLPTGFVKLSQPANIPFDLLAHSLYPVKKQITSDLLDLTGLVFVDFNPELPSVSFCLVVDSMLSESLKHSGFHELAVFTSVGDPGINLWGAKFVLNDVPDVPENISLSGFLKSTLTIENIINVDVIYPEENAVNPVAWMFVSNGLSDAGSKRLQIEKVGDFDLEPHKMFLIRRLYTDSAKLSIKQMHGGYSAQTYQVTSFDREGRKMRPTVLKVANKAIITRESDRCQKFALPYIFNNSAKVLGTAFFGDTGGLTYNFVGIGGENTQLKWLTHYYQKWSAEELEPLFDKVFLQILNPWYGQPKKEKIYPFRDHDPTFTFFPQLCEMGEELFSVSSQDMYFAVKETSQQLVNPYWFLKYEFARLRDTDIDYYTSICHGDLNMQNILLDEDMNVYLIDFSETKPRSVISDFARLEAIFMIDNAPLENEKDLEDYIKFITGFYDSIKLGELPLNTYYGSHKDIVNRNVALCHKMRKYAFDSVGGNSDPVPYCLALLEWVLPIVCYSSAPIANKRVSMIVAGLVCQRLFDFGFQRF